MLSMFGTTYICECKFSNLKYIKSKERNRLRDETLGHLLRVSTTEIKVDFPKLYIEKPHPQICLKIPKLRPGAIPKLSGK
ncbi:hypothetical protein QTP88_024717 [Uroleucon formosanum]